MLYCIDESIVNEIKQSILNYKCSDYIQDVIPVIARDIPNNENSPVKSKNMNKLAVVMGNLHNNKSVILFNENQKNISDIKAKNFTSIKKRAIIELLGFTSGGILSTILIPIPIFDLIPLAGIIVTLIARLSMIYNIPCLKNWHFYIKILISSGVVGILGAITLVGGTIIGNIFNYSLISVVIGSAIETVAVGSFLFGIGMIFIHTFESLYKNNPDKQFFTDDDIANELKIQAKNINIKKVKASYDEYSAKST
jgi:uncharacterized protein (DUF697 family)